MAEIPLQKIDDYRWQIPKTYKPGMRVPGIIYADEKMLKHIFTDNALEQVANVAFLPGIVKYSLAMPDIHWGYGFCLAPDSKIMSSFGYYKKIKDFEDDCVGQDLKCIDFNLQEPVDTPILRFIRLEPKSVYKVITKGGHEIVATFDHPFYTQKGMEPLKDLTIGEKVAIYPFIGVPYERPPSKIIISENNVKETLLNLGREPQTFRFEIILQKLKQRDLLPLTYNHPKLPYILKIMGFIFGDGSMNFIGKRGDGVLHFSGKAEDLEEVRKDIEEIGYTPGPIHFEEIKGNRYYSFSVNASSLVVLLETLGVPRGSKVSQVYRVPEWIFKAPLWQKRLFLASLFGCELRTPHRRLGRKGCFNAPVFPMAKREELIENGKEFLDDITRLLRDFNVATISINKRRRHVSKKGHASWSLELLISPRPENLYNLWAKIGFEYNSKRAFFANVAVQYLKLKLRILREKEDAIKEKIPVLLRSGLSYEKVAAQLAGNPLSRRFIIDVCWKLNKGKEITPRINTGFLFFSDFLKDVTSGLGRSGMVWDEIIKIEKTDYKDFVYDFTVSHPDHNFIADNFVVSNCIGGVAAMDPEQGGVISPGGIGYDINCLTPDVSVLLEDGSHITISELEECWFRKKVKCLDLDSGQIQSVQIINFIKRITNENIYKVTTETGQEIKATGDHPFLTPYGMIQIKDLEKGNEVGIYSGGDVVKESFEWAFSGGKIYKDNKVALLENGSRPDFIGASSTTRNLPGQAQAEACGYQKHGFRTACYVWDRIKKIEKIDYDGYVYDITVNHPSHNFIANNFVVSNCGVRLVRTDLRLQDVQPKLDQLVHALFRDIPCGVGEKGEIRVSADELKKIATQGAKWSVSHGYGEQEDLEFTEENGCMASADPSTLSPRAIERGLGQSGTLGSGNHFIEVQLVEEIYEPKIADVFGLFKGQITVMIHSGSRGFGYQVCDDSLKYMGGAVQKYGFNLPDRQLACAPINSPEGKRYFTEMSCAANYAWANRQALMHLARRVFEDVFGKGYKALGMRLVYDVTHNIGKFEEYEVDGKRKKLFIHRKGATRAFPAGHPAIPKLYKDVGQPVIVPGDMGRNSYVMVGTQKAMEETFGSVCHGAGRLMSRSKAIREFNYHTLIQQLKEKGIVVMSKGKEGLLEEAPSAYKDVNDVVRVVHNSGIARMVAKMRPLGVIKG